MICFINYMEPYIAPKSLIKRLTRILDTRSLTEDEYIQYALIHPLDLIHPLCKRLTEDISIIMRFYNIIKKYAHSDLQGFPSKGNGEIDAIIYMYLAINFIKLHDHDKYIQCCEQGMYVEWRVLMAIPYDDYRELTYSHDIIREFLRQDIFPVPAMFKLSMVFEREYHDFIRELVITNHINLNPAEEYKPFCLDIIYTAMVYLDTVILDLIHNIPDDIVDVLVSYSESRMIEKEKKNDG